MKNSEMYVVRLLPAGRKLQGSVEHDNTSLFGNSKPCVRCLQSLYAFGVKRVYYTTGECKKESGDFDHKAELVLDLLVEAKAQGGHSSKGDRLWGESQLQR